MHTNSVFNPPFQSNFNFPSKTPMFNTIIQKPVSGRGEIRASLQPYPLWKIDYDLQYARGGEQVANSVYQYVLGFFLANGGAFSDFLYFDPNDNQVIMSPLAVGDGSTTTFQLQRSIGIGFDIVQNLNGTPTIYTPAYGNAYGVMNYLEWSQDQPESVWNKTDITIGTITTSPDGGLSAFPATPTGSDSFFFQEAGPSNLSAVGGQFTMSLWLRAHAGMPTIELALLNQVGTVRASAGVTLDTTWNFYTLTGTMQPGDTAIIAQVGGGGSWNTGVGTLDVAWIQLEPGSVANAYIHTQASAYFYTISGTGIVQYSTPPPNGGSLVWTGNYYYRVRFGDDTTTFDQSFDQIWNNGKITLQSVIL